ncbi:hypothetical protein U3516DRAFT_592967 [Neocallimastix sp. 'constans']
MTNNISTTSDIDSQTYMMPSPKTSNGNNSILSISNLDSPNYSISPPQQSSINLTGLGNNNNNSNNNSNNINILPSEIVNQYNPDVSVNDSSEYYDTFYAEKSRFDINPEGPSNGIKIPMPLPVINVNEVHVPSYTSSPLIIQAQQRNYQIWQNYQQIQNNGIPVSSALTLSLLRLMTENLTIARQNSSTITEKILNQRRESQIEEELANQMFSTKFSEDKISDSSNAGENLCTLSDADDEILEEKLDNKVSSSPITKKQSIKKDDRKSIFIDNLILELYETECSYINNLSVMVDTIKSRLLEKDIIPEKAVEVIFFGLAEIRDFSIKLRDSISEATASSDNKIYSISEVFLKHVGDFNCYVNFVSNYSKACITVKSYEKSSTVFAEFLNSIPKMEECKRQDINSFFIMPIQRPMRYSLLLSELNKKNPENEGLEAAMNFMKEMAKTLDQVKRQEEEINGVYTIFNETLYCPRILIKNSEVMPKRLIKTYHGIIFKRTSASVHVMNDSILITKNRKANVKYKYKFQFYIEYSSLIVKKSNKSDKNLAILINKNNPNNVVAKPGNLIAKTSQRISILYIKKESKEESLVCILKLPDGKQAEELLNLINELTAKNKNITENNNKNSSSNGSNDYYNESSSLFNESSLDNTSLYDMSSILSKSIYIRGSLDGPKTRSIGPSNTMKPSRSVYRSSVLDKSIADISFDENDDDENEYDENDYY